MAFLALNLHLGVGPEYSVLVGHAVLTLLAKESHLSYDSHLLIRHGGLEMGILRIFLGMLKAIFAGRATLVSENLALRHQLGVLQRSVRRPKLRKCDRISGHGYCGFGQAGDRHCSLLNRRPSSGGTVRASSCTGGGSRDRSPAGQRLATRSAS